MPERERPAQREEFASEQVKDLLELYFRDPYAFDQYAKTYYYGERAERERARAYYDRRPPTEVYVYTVELFHLVSCRILTSFVSNPN